VRAAVGRIERVARDVQQVIQRSGRLWRARITEIQARIAEQEQAATSLHLATEPIAERLAAKLHAVRGQCPPGDGELEALYANAGIA
jgi:hypothetical protein